MSQIEETDGMKRPSPSVRESIELNHLRSKCLLVSNQAGTVARVATSAETREFAKDLQDDANSYIQRIEGMLQ